MEHLHPREISSIYGISLNAKWGWNGALSESLMRPTGHLHLLVRRPCADLHERIEADFAALMGGRFSFVSASPDSRMVAAITVKSPFSHRALFGFIVWNDFSAVTSCGAGIFA
jgi:hypothetical protein